MSEELSKLDVAGWWRARPRPGAAPVGPKRLSWELHGVALLAAAQLFIQGGFGIVFAVDYGLPAALGLGVALVTAKLSWKGFLVTFGHTLVLAALPFWVAGFTSREANVEACVRAAFVFMPLTAALWSARWRTSRLPTTDRRAIALQHRSADRVVSVQSASGDVAEVRVLGPDETEAEMAASALGEKYRGALYLLIDARRAEDASYRERPTVRLTAARVIPLPDGVSRLGNPARFTADVAVLAWTAFAVLLLTALP